VLALIGINVLQAGSIINEGIPYVFAELKSTNVSINFG
jgi:hypothetical protein